MNISPGDSFKWFFDLGVGVAKIFSTYNKIKNKNMFQNCAWQFLAVLAWQFCAVSGR